MPLLILDIGVCTAAFVVVALIYVLRRRSHLPYPPGPRGLPILGNIFDVPEKRQWLTYARWSEEYRSPIIYFRLLGTPVVVINDIETAQDLFDKRGEIYSERPRLPMINEALGADWNFGFTTDVQHWKVCRRVFEHRFRQIAARAFRPHESSMTHELLNRFLDTPHGFMKHVRHMTGSLILDISHGIKVKLENDEYIQIVQSALEGVEKAAEANIVDIIPWIMHLPAWLPGMGWKKQIIVWRDWSWKMRDAPFDCVKHQLEKGIAKPCLATDLLLDYPGPPTSVEEWEYIAKSVCGTAIVGGADTTVAGVNILIFTMMMCPDVQQKAQRQIDGVVGSDRLPTFQDMYNLPYITAIIREILRWAPLAPFSIPHKTSASDIYKGYYIPKGAVVIGNTWGISRDSEVYPNPERFDPERFLTPEGRLDPSVRKPDSVFGCGRRTCPGRFMAMDSMWITAVSLLATFTFRKPEGEVAKPEDRIYNPELFESGFVGHPLPFKCDIRPRSEKAAQLIRAALQTKDE